MEDAQQFLQARLRQQAALAEFGGRAVRSGDMEDLLYGAVELAARGLETGLSKIVEPLPDGARLLLRAGVGWQPRTIGSTMMAGHSASAPGYALHTGEPVISNDLEEEEERFEIPEVLKRHGVRSSVNVVIRGQRATYGVLEVDSREPRCFGKDDINFLQGFANLLAVAIEHQQAYEGLRRVAEEKAALLRELEHRVKNNLQVIGSLINMQSRMSQSVEVRRQLEIVRNRVESLRLVHQQLYDGGQLNEVDLGNHLRALCNNLQQFYGARAAGVRLDLSLESVQVEPQVATPVGLIVNEFVANSLEHAFPDQSGQIRIELIRVGDRQVRLLLADNGVGMDRSEINQGLGLRLIETLAGQLNARVEWDTVAGTRADLVFSG